MVKSNLEQNTAGVARCGRTGRVLSQLAVTVATVLVLGGVMELGARRLFVATDDSSLPCLNLSDPFNGVTAKPRAVCRQKLLEGELVEYRFNSCGHRNVQECPSSIAADSERIVLVGSSLVEGMGVPMETTFAHRLGEELSKSSHRKVVTYNEGMQWGTPRSVALRVQEVINAKPNSVLWPVTPFDLQNAALRLPYIPGKQEEDHGEKPRPMTAPLIEPAAGSFAARLSASYAKRGGISGMAGAAVDKVLAPLRDSRAVFAVRHYLFLNQHEYVKHFAANTRDSDYLQAAAPSGPTFSTEPFEKYYAQVSDRLRAAGIPLYVSLLPSHAQMSLLSGAAGEFTGLDATRLNATLDALVKQHGDTYVDVFPSFKDLNDPGHYFFAVDEHMNEDGHALVARILARALIADKSYKTRQEDAGASSATGK